MTFMVLLYYQKEAPILFFFDTKEWRRFLFLQLANENKRLRSRHLFSGERARNKNRSREATASAKQMVFMSERNR